MGFAAPVSGTWATAANLARVAVRAEQLGYHSLWTFQRLLSDSSFAPQYRSVLDPVATMGYLAALTSRIRVGVAVLNIPFASPALVAKQLATLDVLTGGRLEIGLGNGWSELEFTASGVSPDRRGARAEEFLTVLTRLFSEPVVDHEGTFYRVAGGTSAPGPVQRPYPPILLGGSAPAALRRAGRRAAGWVSSSRADLGTIAAAVATVRAAAERAGRDPDGLRMVCRGAVRLREGLSGPDRPYLTGTVAQVVEDVARLGEAGVTEFFVDLNFDPEVGSPDADPVAAMDRAERALDGFAGLTAG
ncbi:MAG TPA: TIGR03619 family F420-dependent LLM class oxidoreductase [Rugosimonospora sp.]|nr:TIGR03619 family F420-dependent LLM class oxidoreductase [Rugosimonospora sp.]